MTRLYHEVSIPGLLGVPPSDGEVLVLDAQGYVLLSGLTADDLKRLESHPTGVYTGAAMTELGTVLTVAAGTGIITDSYTDSENPVYTHVEWVEQTIDFGSVTDRQYSYPYIDTAGVLGFDIIQPLPDALRQRIYLGRAVHDISTGNLLASRPEHMLPGQTSQMFADLLYAINVPFLFEGGKVAPNTDLSFATGDSRWFGPAESWQQDKNDPNIANNPGADPTTFQYIDALGNLVGVAITLVDPAQFEEPLGTVVPIPGSANRASIQRLYTSIAGVYLMQYGQQWYDNLEEAINSINADNATFVTNPYVEGASATLVAYFVMEKGATDLADGTDVAIIDPAGIPLGGGGSGAHTHDATYLRLDTNNDPMLAALSMGAFPINDVLDPTLDQDAATKIYVDSQRDHLLYGNPQHTDVDDTDVLAIRDLLAQPESGAQWVSETRLNWRRSWLESATYYVDDTVVDGSYTSVANKTTTDRPAPQPTGVPLWTVPDLPLWIEPQYTGVVVSGIVVTPPAGRLYQVQSFRIWIPDISPNAHYRTLLYDLVTGISSLGTSFDGDIMTAPGWLTVTVDPVFIAEGSNFAFLLISSNSAGTTDFNHPFVRLGNTNQDNDPGAGNWSQDNISSKLRISNTDDDTVDRSAENASVIIGTVLRPADEGDLNAYYEYEVTSSTDMGTWFLYGVTLLDTGGNGEPTIGQRQQIYYEIPLSAPTTYNVFSNHYAADPSLAGYLAFDAVGGGVVGDDAHGADIQVQEYTVSPDWDILAVSGGGGGSGGGDSFSGDHDDLTNVTTSQHHTRYTDAEAQAANDGIFLKLTGGIMSGPIDMAGQQIQGVISIVGDASSGIAIRPAATRSAAIYDGVGTLRQIVHAGAATILYDQAGFQLMRLTSGTVDIYGPLNMQSQKVYSVLDPVDPQDAATKAYVDGGGSGGPYLPLAGGTMAGTINMNSQSISVAGSVETGILHVGNIRALAAAQTLQFQDSGLTDTLVWDQSTDTWRFLRNVEMSGGTIRDDVNSIRQRTASNIIFRKNDNTITYFYDNTTASWRFQTNVHIEGGAFSLNVHSPGIGKGQFGVAAPAQPGPSVFMQQRSEGDVGGGIFYVGAARSKLTVPFYVETGGVQRLRVDALGTYFTEYSVSGGGANCVINVADGRLFVNTSARRFKHNIKPADIADYELEPVSFTHDDGVDYLGFIADDVAAQDARLGVYEDDGEIQNYDLRGVVAILSAKVNRLEGAT